MTEIGSVNGGFGLNPEKPQGEKKQVSEDTEKTLSIFNAIKNYNQSSHAIDTEDSNFGFSLYEKASEAVSDDEKKNVRPNEKDFYDKNGNFNETKFNKAMDKYNKKKAKIDEKYTKAVNKQLTNKDNQAKMNEILNKYGSLGIEVPTPVKDEAYNTEGKMASAEARGYLPEGFKVADLETQKSILKEIGINPDDCEVMPNYNDKGQPDGTYCFKADNAFIKIGTDAKGNVYQAITELNNGVANTTSRQMNYVNNEQGLGKRNLQGEITYIQKNEPEKVSPASDNKVEPENKTTPQTETNVNEADKQEKTPAEKLQDEIAALKQEQDEAYFSTKKNRLQGEIDKKQAELDKLLEKEQKENKDVKTEKNPPEVKNNPKTDGDATVEDKKTPEANTPPETNQPTEDKKTPEKNPQVNTPPNEKETPGANTYPETNTPPEEKKTPEANTPPESKNTNPPVEDKKNENLLPGVTAETVETDDNTTKTTYNINTPNRQGTYIEERSHSGKTITLDDAKASVKEQREKGVPDGMIERALKIQGWNQASIDEIMK